MALVTQRRGNGPQLCRATAPKILLRVSGPLSPKEARVLDRKELRAVATVRPSGWSEEVEEEKEPSASPSQP